LSKLATQSDKSQVFLNKLIEFLVKGLGTGKLPRSPGTFGSLLGLGFVYCLSIIPRNFSYFEVIALIVCFLSWYLIDLYEKNTGRHDDQQVVIDEVAGIFVCFLGVALTTSNLLFGFILFRVFDILKPFPISWVDQKVPGALGTLLDDLLAGLVVCALLHLSNFGGWI
jgi:phosphatidylglycerophosphatase A